MGPRKIHKLRLGKYLFMREFLTKEWSVVDEERGNVDTIDNASIDAVWDSFQFFLELHGYSQDFCSKILLGKLLHEAGVEKVKRGPRKRQKFYYFPLKPVTGSKAESIVATNVQARYNSKSFYSNLNKVKPEYYTLRTNSLGHVSIGILYDRFVTPEKYAVKTLKKLMYRKAIKDQKTTKDKKVAKVQVNVIEDVVHASLDADDNFNLSKHSRLEETHSKRISDAGDITFDVTDTQSSTELSTSVENMTNKNTGKPDSLTPDRKYSNQSRDSNERLNSSIAPNSSTEHDDCLDGELGSIIAKSIARIYEAEDVDEEYHFCQGDRYLTNWDDGLHRENVLHTPVNVSQRTHRAGYKENEASEHQFRVDRQMPFLYQPTQYDDNWMNTNKVKAQWEEHNSKCGPENYPLLKENMKLFNTANKHDHFLLNTIHTNKGTEAGDEITPKSSISKIQRKSKVKPNRAVGKSIHTGAMKAYSYNERDDNIQSVMKSVMNEETSSNCASGHHRIVDKENSTKRTRGRPKGSKNKTPSKKCLRKDFSINEKPNSQKASKKRKIKKRDRDFFPFSNIYASRSCALPVTYPNALISANLNEFTAQECTTRHQLGNRINSFPYQLEAQNQSTSMDFPGSNINDGFFDVFTDPCSSYDRENNASFPPIFKEYVGNSLVGNALQEPFDFRLPYPSLYDCGISNDQSSDPATVEFQLPFVHTPDYLESSSSHDLNNMPKENKYLHNHILP